MQQDGRLSQGCARALALLCLLLCLLGWACPAAQAQGLPAAPASPAVGHGRIDDSNVIVLEAVLDGHVLSDSLTAYQDGDQFLLPLGELARLLTLAITVNAQEGSASGFIIREDRLFGLHVGRALVNVNGREQQIDPSLVHVLGDDIYVAHKALQQWLFIDFEVDLPTLQLRIKPRVRLPMQERLQRERAGAPPGSLGPPASRDGAYPMVSSPYAMARAPFIDQTLGSDARFGRDAAQYKTAYAAYITTDMLGMEAAAYVTASRDKPLPELRMTLARHDPDGQMLGPLHARALELGHVVVPSVPNVLMSGQGGMGVMASNHPLGQPTNFDRHSIRSDLPPGWDVTLYYNDALVGYQPAGADGRYAFDDLPLSFGPNEFRLVFNGPLGQVRVEKQHFLLDQSVVKPGEVFYALAHQQTPGGSLDVAQLDLGLTQALSAQIGVVRQPAGERTPAASYSQLGLRTYWDGLILNAQLTQSPGGGLLTDTGIKTRVGRYALAAEHIQRNQGFYSEVFAAGQDNIRFRDKLGLTGSVQTDEWAPISMALEAARDVLASGSDKLGVAARVSTLLGGSAVSNSVRWQRDAQKYSTEGSMQVSRRVIDIGLNAQLDYALRPEVALRTLALTADHSLANGYRINGGVLHSPTARSTQFSGGLSKSFGGFAMAVSAGYSTRHELIVGLQLFMALGRDPRSGNWFGDAQPLAGTGAVSVQAFVDKNMNGVRDPDEEPVPNAGFFIGSGGRYPARTGRDGTAFINRLSPAQYADIALDPSTLEDPQWKPSVQGVRVLPRPGVVQVVDFPVIYTAEVEGTVYLVDAAGRRRGIGDARLELVNAQGEVLATTKSSPDGYYLLHQVAPGPATLRIAPEQARKLRLTGALSRPLQVPADGEFLSGQDFELQIQAQHQ